MTDAQRLRELITACPNAAAILVAEYVKLINEPRQREIVRSLGTTESLYVYAMFDLARKVCA